MTRQVEPLFKSPPGPKTRRKPLRRRGAKTEREADELAEFRRIVHARRWCEGAGMTCREARHEGTAAHHVYPSDRDLGIHSPERGLLLCEAGHRFTHTHPEWSYRHGFLGRAT